MGTGPPPALQLVRAGYGVLQLARPGLIADRLLAEGLNERGRTVARILGVRQLVQAVGSGRRPSYPTLALGVEVDLLHAASMLALALSDRRRRRSGLTDAAIAASFAFGGVLAARQAARRPQDPQASGGLQRLRERCAERLAQLLVPRYPPTDMSP
jgi:hypothetical protein